MLAFGSPSATQAQDVVVASNTVTTAPGGDAAVAFSISNATGKNVASISWDFLFDSANLSIGTQCGDGTPCQSNAACLPASLCLAPASVCEKDARLTDHILQVARTSAGVLSVLISDTSIPIGTFGDGNLFTCTFVAGSQQGTFPLSTDFLEVGDNSAGVVDATAQDGSIIVEVPPPTDTPTITRTPTETPTQAPATQTPTKAPATLTPTKAPTSASSGFFDDDGCQISATGTSGSAWFLLIPAAVLFAVRRKNR